MPPLTDAIGVQTKWFVFEKEKDKRSSRILDARDQKGAGTRWRLDQRGKVKEKDRYVKMSAEAGSGSWPSSEELS